MTIVYKREEFEAGSGLMLYIEQYAEKPYFVKFWRYGPMRQRSLKSMVWRSRT